MDALVHDIRFALRSFRRAPLFTLVTLVTLGLGLGGATAVFSVANAILLRPLPVREQDRVVMMWARQRDFEHVPMRWVDVDRFARSSRVFAEVGAVDYNGAWTWAMAERGEPMAVKGTWVSGRFFDVLGVRPQVGRTIRAEDDVPNAPRVVVITDGLWRRRYGADSTVVGRVLDYQGARYTIVGVAPRGFEYPQGVELWTAFSPFFPDARGDGASGQLDLVARLRPGATVEQGRAELDAFLETAYARWRDEVGRYRATARAFRDVVVGDVRPVVLILSAAVALVLLLVCVNVANLLLVRGVARAREIAIRTSLGAGRRRIVRQLLTESGLLAAAGALLGAAIAAAGVRVLVALSPPDVPRLSEVGVDGRAIAFAAALTLAATLLFGTGPALALVRGQPNALARSGGSRSATASRASTRTKRALIAAQAALAVVLLAGAGVLLRSLVKLQQVDMGFDRDRLVIAQLTVTWSRFGDPGGRQRYADMLDRLRAAAGALPGVTAVAAVTSPPYSGTGGWDALPTAEGQSEARRAANPWVNLELVTPGYFEALRVPLRRGRLPAESDRETAPSVAVVNETMARRYWPGQDPIGKRLRFGAADAGRPWATVVGVVEDMRYRELASPRPSIYLPARQFSGGTPPTWLAMRTAVPAEALVPQLRQAFAAVDPDAAVVGARTMDEYLSRPLARPRFSTALLGVFAGIALVLAAVGIYAVVAEYVRHRRREIGIRVALGARSGDVRRLVVGEGLWPVTLGAAAGVAASLGALRLLESQLYGVRPGDAPTLAAVVLVVLAVAVMACLVPARQAARVSPVDVMRVERPARLRPPAPPRRRAASRGRASRAVPLPASRARDCP